MEFNEWFLSLVAERQAALRDDKWALADAAFEAGKLIGSGAELSRHIELLAPWLPQRQHSRLPCFCKRHVIACWTLLTTTHHTRSTNTLLSPHTSSTTATTRHGSPITVT